MHTPISDVAVLDRNIFTSLSSGRATLSFQVVLKFTSRIIVLPINHKGANGVGFHCTIAGYYPKSKTIIHCDSYHKIYNSVDSILYSFIKALLPNAGSVHDWCFVSPTDIYI